MNTYDDKYDKWYYNIVNGIKLYDGTSKHNLKIYNNNIDFYKVPNTIITELIPSTLTVLGHLTNVTFIEEDIIGMLNEPKNGYILKIKCNFGSVNQSNPLYIEPPPKPRVSKRGRKCKPKPQSNRKKQGDGSCFSSIIGFDIYNTLTKKICKLKVFRTGCIGYPGGRRTDLTDTIPPLIILRDYLRTEFMFDDIEISYLISVMRNGICILKGGNLFRLKELELVFNNAKIQKENTYDEIIKYIDPKIAKYIKNVNMIGIAEIQHNCERYFGLTIKFYRPLPWDLKKKMTLKVLRSGKLNFDGGNSELEVVELYYWFVKLLTNNYKSVIYDKNAINEYSDSDTCSNTSIYDDDLESD